MSASFASQAWADSFAASLLESSAVRSGAETWVFGPLVFVLDADAEHGVEATGIRIDLHAGTARGVQLVAPAEASRAPFAIGGSLGRWKDVFGGSLQLVDGILQSKLRVRGDLPTLVRHRSLLDGVVAAAGTLDTTWQDEQEPVAVSAG